MLAVHSFIAAFTKAVGGVFFQLSALEAPDAGRLIGKPVFFDVAGLAQPPGAAGFELAALRADYFLRVAKLLVLVLVTSFAQTFGVVWGRFSAFGTCDLLFHFRPELIQILPNRIQYVKGFYS